MVHLQRTSLTQITEFTGQSANPGMQFAHPWACPLSSFGTAAAFEGGDFGVFWWSFWTSHCRACWTTTKLSTSLQRHCLRSRARPWQVRRWSWQIYIRRHKAWKIFFLRRRNFRRPLRWSMQRSLLTPSMKDWNRTKCIFPDANYDSNKLLASREPPFQPWCLES